MTIEVRDISNTLLSSFDASVFEYNMLGQSGRARDVATAIAPMPALGSGWKVRVSASHVLSSPNRRHVNERWFSSLRPTPNPCTVALFDGLAGLHRRSQ